MGRGVALIKDSRYRTGDDTGTVDHSATVFYLCGTSPVMPARQTGR